MKFNRALNESTPGGLKYSIDVVLEVKTAGKMNNSSKNTFEVVYKWINASFRNEEDEAFIKLKKLTQNGPKGPVNISKMPAVLIKELTDIGLGKYVAPISDSSWSELLTGLAKITNNYPKKMRAFDVKKGEDIVIHIRYETDDQGNGKFRPGGDAASNTVVNPQEEESFPLS